MKSGVEILKSELDAFRAKFNTDDIGTEEFIVDKASFQKRNEKRRYEAEAVQAGLEKEIEQVQRENESLVQAYYKSLVFPKDSLQRLIPIIPLKVKESKLGIGPTIFECSESVENVVWTSTEEEEMELKQLGLLNTTCCSLNEKAYKLTPEKDFRFTKNTLTYGDLLDKERNLCTQDILCVQENGLQSDETEGLRECIRSIDCIKTTGLLPSSIHARLLNILTTKNDLRDRSSKFNTAFDSLKKSREELDTSINLKKKEMKKICKEFQVDICDYYPSLDEEPKQGSKKESVLSMWKKVDNEYGSDKLKFTDSSKIEKKENLTSAFHKEVLSRCMDGKVEEDRVEIRPEVLQAKAIVSEEEKEEAIKEIALKLRYELSVVEEEIAALYEKDNETLNVLIFERLSLFKYARASSLRNSVLRATFIEQAHLSKELENLYKSLLTVKTLFIEVDAETSALSCRTQELETTLREVKKELNEIDKEAKNRLKLWDLEKLVSFRQIREFFLNQNDFSELTKVASEAAKNTLNKFIKELEELKERRQKYQKTFELNEETLIEKSQALDDAKTRLVDAKSDFVKLVDSFSSCFNQLFKIGSDIPITMRCQGEHIFTSLAMYQSFSAKFKVENEFDVVSVENAWLNESVVKLKSACGDMTQKVDEITRGETELRRLQWELELQKFLKHDMEQHAIDIHMLKVTKGTQDDIIALKSKTLKNTNRSHRNVQVIRDQGQRNIAKSKKELNMLCKKKRQVENKNSSLQLELQALEKELSYFQEIHSECKQDTNEKENHFVKLTQILKKQKCQIRELEAKHMESKEQSISLSLSKSVY